MHFILSRENRIKIVNFKIENNQWTDVSNTKQNKIKQKYIIYSVGPIFIQRSTESTVNGMNLRALI